VQHARSPRKLIGVAAATTALLLAACGNDDDDSQPDDATVTTAPADDPDTTAPEEVDEEAITAEVTTNIEAFFDALAENRYDDAAALLENGEDHIDDFEGFAELAVGVSAETKDVEVLDATTAIYTIDILIAGAVALPDSSGEAVLIDGRWVMSEGSWNALAALAPQE
jgi:ABC-type oligopeptide transport system substrate-binding subunit